MKKTYELSQKEVENFFYIRLLDLNQSSEYPEKTTAHLLKKAKKEAQRTRIFDFAGSHDIN